MIEDIAGVIIWTDSLERMVPFYRDRLMLEPHSVQPDFVAFRFGDIRLSIGLHSEVSGSTREPHRIMVNLGVTDIHSTYSELAARGVVFVRPPEKEHWGGWVATFRDPDGNLLQLLQPDAEASPGTSG